MIEEGTRCRIVDVLWSSAWYQHRNSLIGQECVYVDHVTHLSYGLPIGWDGCYLRLTHVPEGLDATPCWSSNYIESTDSIQISGVKLEPIMEQQWTHRIVALDSRDEMYGDRHLFEGRRCRKAKVNPAVDWGCNWEVEGQDEPLLREAAGKNYKSGGYINFYSGGLKVEEIGSEPPKPDTSPEDAWLSYLDMTEDESKIDPKDAFLCGWMAAMEHKKPMQAKQWEPSGDVIGVATSGSTEGVYVGSRPPAFRVGDRVIGQGTYEGFDVTDLVGDVTGTDRRNSVRVRWQLPDGSARLWWTATNLVRHLVRHVNGPGPDQRPVAEWVPAVGDRVTAGTFGGGREGIIRAIERDGGDTFDWHSVEFPGWGGGHSLNGLLRNNDGFFLRREDLVRVVPF